MNRNLIEIYVRSSPLGSVGIHWRNISKNGQPIEEPEVLKSRIISRDNGKKATINSLINDTKPSVILARYKGKILLEVTGLEASKERSSQLGRRITEVVLWVGDASTEVELQLRKLAAFAILNIWDKDSTPLKSIRDAIRFEELNAFRVDQGVIEQLSDESGTSAEAFSQTALIHSDSSVWSSPELITNEEHLYSLAHQITQVPLPETEQPVVIVAEMKNEYLEYKGNIWKAPIQPEEIPVALTEETSSPLVHSVYKHGSSQIPAASTEEVDFQAEKKKLSTQPESTPFPTTRILILGCTSVILAIIIILMSLQWKPPVKTTPSLTAPPEPTPTAITTPISQLAPVKLALSPQNTAPNLLYLTQLNTRIEERTS